MGDRFADRVVVITGASSGLGRAAAELFAREGAHLILGSSQPRGEAVATAIGADFVQTDVTDSKAVDALVDAALDRHGRLDIMVNNAGSAGFGPLETMTDAEFRRITGINFDGVFYGMRAAGRVMLEQGNGIIVNVASNGGILPTAQLAVYCAAKAAVVALSRAAAVEFAGRGVRVNCLCPGTMLTGMTEGLSPEQLKFLDTIQPIGRASHPEEIARTLLFLASDDASYVAGHALVVDGAMTAGQRPVF